MPVHDWTKVDAGIFHDFHTAWLVEIRNALNGGLLPAPYYALAEQAAGLIGPDVLTLERRGKAIEPRRDPNEPQTRTAVAVPPKVALVIHRERRHYQQKHRRLSIRHRSSDRLVAIIEIVSQGNKADRSNFNTFVDKAVSVLVDGIPSGD